MIASDKDPDRELAKANVMLSPAASAAVASAEYLKGFGETDISALMHSLADSMPLVHEGNMKGPESMLIGQAHAQCCRTLEVLSAMKNPPLVLARQANVTTGPQQINNGTPESCACLSTAPSGKITGTRPPGTWRLVSRREARPIHSFNPCPHPQSHPQRAG